MNAHYAAVAIAAIVGNATSAAPLHMVARSGQPAPGTAAVFNEFRTASINAAGALVFGATLRDGAGSVNWNNDQGLWSNGRGALELIARKGDPAPGGSIFRDAYDYAILNNSGDVLFEGAVPYGENDGFTDGLWISTSVGLTRVVRAETASPPPISGGFLFPYGLALSDAGVFAFSADSRIRDSIDDAYALWAGTGSNAVRVMTRLDSAPVTGAVFEEPGPPLLNNSGEVLFNGYLRLGVGGVTWLNNSAAWRSGPNGPELLLREGDAAPDTGGATFADFSVRALTDSGTIALSAHLRVTGNVTEGNDAGIWIGPPGALRLLVREGDPAPGTTGSFNSNEGLSDAVSLGPNADFAFFATLDHSYGGVDETNDVGIWLSSHGPIRLAARAGSHAPGTRGVFDAHRFEGAAVNARGQLAFLATSVESDTHSPYYGYQRGVWIMDSSGSARLIVREGQPLRTSDVGVPGLRITGLTKIALGAQTATQQTSFNDDGLLVFAAVMEDVNYHDSWGVFVIDTTPTAQGPDLNADGVVGPPDLMNLLSAWGECFAGGCPEDLTGDGFVDSSDLALLLASWGARQ